MVIVIFKGDWGICQLNQNMITSSEEAAEDDGLNSAEGKLIEKTTF